MRKATECVLFLKKTESFRICDCILTCVDLLEGLADPDIVQAESSLGRACANVGELGGGHQGTQLLLPQDLQLRGLGGAAKVPQDHQLLLSCTGTQQTRESIH